jgi:hypothetical protein
LNINRPWRLPKGPADGKVQSLSLTKKFCLIYSKNDANFFKNPQNHLLSRLYKINPQNITPISSIQSVSIRYTFSWQYLLFSFYIEAIEGNFEKVYQVDTLSVGLQKP